MWARLRDQPLKCLPRKHEDSHLISWIPIYKEEEKENSDKVASAWNPSFVEAETVGPLSVAEQPAWMNHQAPDKTSFQNTN